MLKQENVVNITKKPGIVIPFIKAERKSFEELQRFRDSLEDFQLLYQTHKGRSRTYRNIFFALGLLFLFLTAFIYFQAPIWTSLLSSTIIRKEFIALSSIFCSLAAFYMGFSIQSEREAVVRLMEHAKSNLKYVYDHQKVRFGIHRFFLFCEEYLHATALRSTYRKTLFQLKEAKDASLLLMKKIRSSKHLDSVEKNRLFNQTLMELQDRLNAIVSNFQH